MTDARSLLDRWFPSRVKDRAMQRSVRTLVDQITAQNGALKEIAERVSRQESNLSAIQALNDDVRAVHMLLDEQATTIRGVQKEFERLDTAVTAARHDVRDLANPLATQTRTLQELGDRIESGNERMRHIVQAGLDERIAHVQQQLEKITNGAGAAVAAQNQLLKDISARIDANHAGLADAVSTPLTRQIGETQLSLREISNDVRNAITHLGVLVSEAHGDTRDLRAPLALLQHELPAMQDRLVQQLAERMETNNAMLRDAIQGSLAQRLAEAQLWLEKISAENQSALSHLDGGITGVRGGVGGIANQLAEAQLWLEKISTETTNGLTHLDGRAAEVRLWLEKISTETNNGLTHLDGRTATEFNRLFNAALPQVNTQSHVAAALLLNSRTRGVDRSRWIASELERYRSAREDDFDRTLAKVAADFPSVAREWRERLDTMTSAFATTKTGNAANASDLYSQMFKSFVEYHVNGRVLDVGCGVFGRPFYLSDYPADLVSGIEPLDMIEASDFECVRGISEYLPWMDDSFSTVVNATSLDHVASLEKSLAEMARVLRPDGTLLLWIGSIKGSPEFKADSPQFVPADQFHLFHFDAAWFEPMLAPQWDMVERMEFAMPSFDHVFYALRSRKRR